jgi:hypothetical protein
VHLRCADAWSDLEIRLQTLMETVGLDTLEDVRAGTLTGGQLKLLSVAIGLVQRPSVLYLDEPTTGLDSTAASVVMECESTIHPCPAFDLRAVPALSVFSKRQRTEDGVVLQTWRILLNLES